MSMNTTDDGHEGALSRATKALAEAHEHNGALICAHRGSHAGNVAQNTGASAAAAWLRGADIVELDVVRTTDGRYVCFHDHYERVLLDADIDVLTASFADIEAHPFYEKTDSYSPSRINTVEELFAGGDGISHCALLYSIDRCWSFWDEFLPWLSRLPQRERCVLKCPVKEEYFDDLARSPYPFAVIPIVLTADEVDTALAAAARTGINLVGFEFVFGSTDHPFVTDHIIEKMKKKGLYVLLNAMNLGNGKNLAAGFDDDTSLFDSADKGWGELIRLGADIIQTDWPDLLARYLGRRS